MGFDRIRLIGFALAAVGMAGCGGSGSGGTGGGGGGGNPTTVTFTFKGVAPTAVAAKIGSGAFSAKTLSSGAITLSIPDGETNFAVAYVCTVAASGLFGPTTNESIVEASTADGTSFSLPACASGPTGETGTLTGSVDASAISGANYTAVAAANSSTGMETFVSGATSNFSVTMPAGTDRVGVGAYVYTSGPFGANSVWTLAALRNFDGVTVPGAVNSGATVALGAADAVTQQPITYKNAPSGYTAPSTLAFYEWSGGGAIQLSNGATSQYPAVPAAAAENGDFYTFTAMAFGAGGAVLATSTSPTAGPLTITFPAAWSYAGPTPAALPTFNFNYTGFAGQSGVSNAVLMTWSPQNNAQNLIEVQTSSKFLNGSTTVSIPDLSSVPGFLAAPASNAQVLWGAEVLQSSTGFLQTSAGTGSVVGVEASGTYRVP